MKFSYLFIILFVFANLLLLCTIWFYPTNLFDYIHQFTLEQRFSILLPVIILEIYLILLSYYLRSY